MSLILDALNKSDRDAKQTGTVPTIHHHVTPPENNKRLQPTIFWLTGGFIFTLAALALVLLGQHLQHPASWGQASETPAPKTVETLLAPSGDGPSTPKPADDENRQPMTEPGLTADAPSMQAATPKVTALESDLGQTIVPVASHTIPNPDPAVAKLYAQNHLDEVTESAPPSSNHQNPTTPSSISPEDAALAQHLWKQSAPTAPPQVKQRSAQPVEETKLNVAPEPATAVTHSIAHHQDVPFLHRLPEAFQNSIPSLMYAEHHFDQGFIVMNKKKVQVGEAAADGVVVEAILEDGAILSFKDRRFKLAAQSSWVNYQ